MATDYSKRSGRKLGFAEGGLVGGVMSGLDTGLALGDRLANRRKKKDAYKAEDTSTEGEAKDAFRRGGRVSKRSC